MKDVQFYVKHNYGVAQYYLADPEIARHVARLTGRKTVTDSDFAALISLGFTFTQILPPSSPSHAFNRTLTPQLSRV